MRHILSVAASDSCAGAGIQADIKTISALGEYAVTAITAVTAQNTAGIKGIEYLDPNILRLQLEALFEDIRIDAIKIGMLGSRELIEVLADCIGARINSIPVVLDPVLESSTGFMLSGEDLRPDISNLLFPLTTVLTPNLPEAESFLNYTIKDLASIKQACRDLLNMGPEWVVLKGGHLDGEPLDVIANKLQTWIIPGKRVSGGNNHGTGCTFSAALAVFLARGCTPVQAVSRSKAYIEGSLDAGFRIGHGPGVLDHFYAVRNKSKEEL